MACSVAALISVSGAKATPPSEGAAVAQRLWDKLLTKCGDTYFYGGSVFDGSGMLSNVQVGHQAVLEYRGVRFRSVPIRVTDAERANGLSYRARITMIAHLYREGGGAWRDGPDLRPRNIDDILGRAIGSANADMFDMGGNGAMALSLVRFMGTWAVARSSVDSTSSIGFSSNYFDVEKLIARPTARYSCERAAIVPPPPTAAEIAAKAEAERKAKQAVIDETARQATIERVKAEGLAKWSWTGSALAFRRAFADNFFKRAAEFGLDPHNYNGEFTTLINLVESCKLITREEYAQVRFGPRHETEREKLLHGCDGTTRGRMGPFGRQISPDGQARIVDVDERVSTIDPKTNQLGMGDTFTVNVYLEPLENDPSVPYEETFGKYVIISAKIRFEPQAGAPATDAPK